MGLGSSLGWRWWGAGTQEKSLLVISLLSHCHQSPHSLVASRAESHQAQSLMPGQLQSPLGYPGSDRGTACASPLRHLQGSWVLC